MQNLQRVSKTDSVAITVSSHHYFMKYVLCHYILPLKLCSRH